MKDVELSQWREAYQDLMNEEPETGFDEGKLAELVLKEEKSESDAAMLERICENPENLMKMKTALALKSEIESDTKSHKKGWNLQWMSLAAAVLLVAAGVWSLTFQNQNAGHFNNFQDDGITRNTQQALVTTPSNASIFSEAPKELSIDLTETDETAFQFVILTSEGSIVWEGEKSLRSKVTITEPVRSKLISGEYLWYVQYDFSENSQRYGPFSFSVD